MSPDQEKMAEQILLYHKSSNGILNWNSIEYDETQKIIIKKELIEKSLIKPFIEESTMLSDDGWQFSGFEDLRKKISREKEMSIQKEKYDVLSKQFIYRTRYVPFIFSSLALIVSILVYLKKPEKDKYFPVSVSKKTPPKDTLIQPRNKEENKISPIVK
ncbi:hypothetical protein [Chitinophaga sp. S165]|uniref:hypothetical protein n=1 Tax=Chitinophaga sp. S165 TaxID=2135462 RepID=UPI000D7102BD|nr:hypothetical protein [Chitinophaga sp. S165]PWV46592.1 hypothetical protein C7475_110153 [Chitinophaga sp. S165]